MFEMIWAIWWVWIIAALVLATLEVVAPAQIFLGFAIGALGVGIAGTGCVQRNREITATARLRHLAPSRLRRPLPAGAILRATLPRFRGDAKMLGRSVIDQNR